MSLTQEIHTMTWRTFCVLLSYLPADSATVQHNAEEKEEIRIVHDPQELAQFLGI